MLTAIADGLPPEAGGGDHRAMTTTAAAPAVTDARVEAFRREGFVKVEQIITRGEALSYRAAAETAVARLTSHAGDDEAGLHVLRQYVNVWREDQTLASLTLDPRVGAAAEALAGKPLRLWHDHVLIKRPGKSRPTALHQDQPFWPHDRPETRGPLSAWIALGDVTVEHGCMSFIPGSHTTRGLTPQSTGDDHALIKQVPALAYAQRATVPLRAGDCTFHYGTTAHAAFANVSDTARVAHVVIFMEADTRFDGRKHPVTEPLNLSAGDPLDGELFPRVGSKAG